MMLSKKEMESFKEGNIGRYAKEGDTRWEEYKEEAERNGVSRSLYSVRVIRDNMTPKQAASTPVREKDRLYEIDGVVDTRKGHCDRMGVKYGTIAASMSYHGISFEEEIDRRRKKHAKHTT